MTMACLPNDEFVTTLGCCQGEGGLAVICSPRLAPRFIHSKRLGHAIVMSGSHASGMDMKLPTDAHYILSLYRERGGLAYDGEGVTQLQHGWQCAALAKRAHASDELELAAWLHDLGHLLTDAPGSPTLEGLDDAHERRGAEILAAVFGLHVSEPVALHVQAKRALVTSQPLYLKRLSADSTRSLALQGGLMNADEFATFEKLPHARDAMRLRVWDDDAKVPTLRPGSSAQGLRELEALMLRVLSNPHGA